MIRYQDRVGRGECLAGAVMWTIVLAIQLSFFLYAGHSLDPVSMGYVIVLVLVQTVCCVLQWYHYLAYNKKKTDYNNNLGGNPHER